MLACPSCGHTVKPGAKFCKHCGFRLDGATARDTASESRGTSLARLRSAAPKAVADKIQAARGRGEGERKQVTALFTDIVGSTALAEQLDPEDWREIVTGAHKRVSEAVFRYEGTIAQLLGDGVLTFFGAPIAHEDDPERAIRAALDVLSAIKHYAAELRQTRGLDAFQMRVGLNTGLVVVGHIGSDLHMEYLAVGDTINLAARMQSAAEPDTVLVSHNTQRLATNLFEYEDRGQLSLKGKADPVQAYRVIGAIQGATRTRGIIGLSSPLVGRRHELAALANVLDGVRQGRGSVVSIVGEAGLGKSRLTAEWRKLTTQAEPHVRWVEGRCLSFTTNAPHHLSSAVVRALCNVPADAGEAQVARQLRECLGALPALDVDETWPYLAHLLGLQLEDDAVEKVKYLDGAALSAHYVTALRALLLAAAKQSPLVVSCEDVHWADRSSVEVLERAVDVAEEAPIVFAFVSRPDRDAPGWQLVESGHHADANAIDIRLAPLNDDDSRQLVSNLLEIEALPNAVRELILAKAEGNPFFVEEVVRMLIDRGGIVRNADTGSWAVTRAIQSIEIPDTLQGVLASRIDRLPPEAKRVLQVAAVIGRRFQVNVLESVLQAGVHAAGEADHDA